MEASIPSRLWISCGEAEVARLYRVSWEKQPPLWQEFNHFPSCLTIFLRIGVCMKGCGRMGKSRESSPPWKALTNNTKCLQGSHFLPLLHQTGMTQPQSHIPTLNSAMQLGKWRGRTTSSSLQIAHAQEYVPEIPLLQGPRGGTELFHKIPPLNHHQRRESIKHRLQD